jgi:hypothetical protein
LRIVVLIVLIVLTAFPTAGALAEIAKPPYVRLNIINASQFEFSISIYGPEDYYISVPARASDFIFVKRDWYTFTMNACNYAETGTLNMNMEQTIHVPVCGGRALTPGYKPHHVDVADYIKPVKAKLRNKTGEPVGIYIRTVDEHHFLNINAGEIQFVFLLKKQYAYSYLACGKLQVGYYTPFVSVPFDLTCSK